MPARKRSRLTDAAITRLRPREREYAVWDSSAPGLGVRVRPTGGKTWVLLTEAGGRSKRVTLAPISTMTVAEARRECHERRARPEAAEVPGPAHPVPPFRDFVETEWQAAHVGRYKPSTVKGVRALLAKRLLPAFGNRRLDRIAPAEVRRWFDAFSRTAPGNANHGLALLRQIMNFAVARGHVDKNPTQGIRPNRRPKLTRFLSRDEIARLHRALDAETARGNRQQADIVRLLLLTGCRRGEIVGLLRSEVQADALVLADSKTGPRRVPLSARARCILDRQPRSDSAFVFPSSLDPSRPRASDLRIWDRVRREGGHRGRPPS